MILRMVILLHYLITASTQTYYVNKACGFNTDELLPCISIEELANNSLGDVSNTSTFYFVSEEYNVHKDLRIKFEQKMVEILAMNRKPVDIYCTNNGSVSFKVKGSLRMEFMRFHKCANLDPLINIWEASQLQTISFINCSFNTNFHHSVLIRDAKEINLHIINCLFQYHFGYAAISSNDLYFFSTYEIRNTMFKNNSAGAVALQSVGRLHVNNCSFTNNSIGAIAVTGQALTYTTGVTVINSTFISNSGTDGGALSAIDFEDIYIANTLFDGNIAKDDGGAIYLEFDKNEKPADVVLTGCSFQYNSASQGGGINSITSRACKATLYFNDSQFYGNSAQKGGALNIYQYEPISSTKSRYEIKPFIDPLIPPRSVGFPWENHFRYPFLSVPIISLPRVNQPLSIIINYTIFAYNVVTVSGGALCVKSANKMILNNSYFGFNFAYVSEDSKFSPEYGMGGAAFLFLPDIAFLIQNCTFYGCYAHNGGALYLDGGRYLNGNVTIIKSEFEANKAREFGGAIITAYKKTILRDCNFTENQAVMGGAIQCNHGYINSTGLLLHTNNATKNGGGISLNQCHLVLKGKSNFTSNTAFKNGGAIFSNDRKEDCTIENQCAVSWNMDSVIYFVNNFAQNGSVLYGGMIDGCNYSNIERTLIVKKFNRLPNDLAITSDATQLCFCDNDISCCKTRYTNRTVYPGQTFTIPVACVNQVGRALECDLHSSYNGTTKIHLGEAESSLTLNGHENLTFHAFTKHKVFGKLLLTADIFCDQQERNTLLVGVFIQETCPLGFHRKKDRCQCDPRLRKIFPKIECNINNKSITIGETGWIGYDEKSLRIYSKLCPLNHCSYNKNVCPTCSSAICRNNHDGVLCGGCVQGYSTVLGSNKCKKCSQSQKYNFVWLTIVIALAGVALVVFLLLVKMTVSSGTTNGLIFYANIVSFSGLLDTMTTCSNYSKILHVFISWINLDFGVEICFYLGMGIYEKTWLQFAFPLYIWFLVAVIIILCHYSSSVIKIMGRRNIEVLATLFLLSYAKLLKTIVTALSFTDIEVANASNVSDIPVSQRVWAYDGNIQYLSTKHLPLFVVALLFFFLLFLPYTLLLLLGQFIGYLPSRRGLRWLHSTAVSAVLDCYHAPYTNHSRYWTGLGLVIRCCLFAIFGTSYDLFKNQFFTSITVLLILAINAFISSKIYRNKFVNILEVFYVVNLGALSTSLQFKQDFCVYLTISTTLSLAAFIIVLVYHLFILIKDNFKFCEKMGSILPSKLLHREIKDTAVENQNNTVEIPSTTFIELREALLDS